MAAETRSSKSASKSSSKAGASASPSAATTSKSGTPDYGQDSPLLVRRMFSRGGWTLAFGIVLWFMNRQEYPGVAIELLIVLALIAAVFFAAGWLMIQSSKTGKLAMREKLLDALNLQGEEKVLDAGCGRGLMAIGAAKRLKTGKVSAVDLWSPQALSGNSGDAARDNAKIEGVTDRVRVENGDMRKLAYPKDNFDIVMCTWAIHHMDDEPDRDESVRELYRVLKPGGRLLIADIKHTGRYAEILRECGAQDVAVASLGFLWCLPNKVVTARSRLPL